MKKHANYILALACTTIFIIGCEVEVAPECPKNGEKKCIFDKKIIEVPSTPCTINICKNNKWEEQEEHCDLGIKEPANEDEVVSCKKQCEIEGAFSCKICDDDNDEKCFVNNTNESCTLHECQNGKWIEKKDCKFGYTGNNECVDPCSIRGNYNYIYDNGTHNLLKCTDDGWTTANNECNSNVDITKIILADEDQESFNLRLKKYVDASDKELLFSIADETNKHEYYFAKCGTCKQGLYPDRCIETESSSVLFVCQNGIEPVEGEIVDDCKEYFPEICNSDDGSNIYVNTTNNIKNCGECGIVCENGWYCKNSDCRPQLECENGYTDHPTKPGVRARCIDSLDSLKAVRDEINSGFDDSKRNPNKQYILIKDIIIDEPWIPIGTEDNPFKGTFDGNDKTITINDKFIPQDSNTLQPLGLFGYVLQYTFHDNTFPTSISKLNINWNGNSQTNGTSFGLLVGKAKGVHINNISITANKIPLTGNFNSTGGLVGEAIDCSLNNNRVGNVVINPSSETYKPNNIGCLVGSSTSTNITTPNSIKYNEVSDCKIIGNTNLGGLIGISNNDSIVENKLSSLTIDGNGDNIGGLIGSIIVKSSIQKCKASFNSISGNNAIGGLVGKADDGISIELSHSEGRISGINNVGGLIGHLITSEEGLPKSNSAYNFFVINKNTSEQYFGGLIGSYERTIKYDDLQIDVLNTIHIIKSLNSKSDTTGLGEFFGNITVIERNDISRVNLISKTMYSISSGYIPDYLIGHIDVTSNNNDRLGCANKLPRLHYISTSNRAFTNEHSNTVFCKNKVADKIQMKDLTSESLTSLYNTDLKKLYKIIKCKSDDIKTAIGCQNDECKDLIDILCQDQSQPCEFKLPVPYSGNYIVLPSFCEEIK